MSTGKGSRQEMVKKKYSTSEVLTTKFHLVNVQAQMESFLGFRPQAQEIIQYLIIKYIDHFVVYIFRENYRNIMVCGHNEKSWPLKSDI